MSGFFEKLKKGIYHPIFSVGDTDFSLWLIGVTFFALWLLLWVAGRISSVLERVLSKHHGSKRLGRSVVQIVRYAIVIIGTFIILQNLGLDLSTLGLLSGALGVGLGFGLQNIVNNFISGIIILFERPIKVGDRIEVDNVQGDVVLIGARSTQIRTNDNITIIVPNSKFIADNVINWTLTEEKVRFKIPFYVDTHVDYKEVESLIVAALLQLDDVAKQPKPSVRFMAFGERGLNLEASVWSSTLVHKKGQLTSEVNEVIHRTLRANNIAIPSPKRELTIDNSGAQERI